MKTDVLIVGGGPAGLATSIALAQRGVRSVVVEALGPGIDKACGEGLMPDAIESLARLGVRISAEDGHKLRGLLFCNETDQVQADFPRSFGVGVRRPRLHRLLAARAEECGVRLRWDTHARLTGPHSAELNGEPVRFDWLVGADGQASSIRRWAGLDQARVQIRRFGFRRHYRVAAWSDRVQVFWGARGQVFVTPIAEDCVGIIYISRSPHADFDGMFAQFPELGLRLRGTELDSSQRGGASVTRRLSRVHRDGVALVGDASGSADPATGEGLTMSFQQALALAEAVAGGSLAAYGQAHRRIGTMPHRMGRLLLAMDRWSGVQTLALRALARTPGALSDLLAVHLGAKRPLDVALTHGPQLAYNLLVAAGEISNTRPPRRSPVTPATAGAEREASLTGSAS